MVFLLQQNKSLFLQDVNMFAERQIKWYLVHIDEHWLAEKTRKKVLQPLMILALAIPGLAFANEPSKNTAANAVKDENTTVMSPRTGIRYTFANPQQRPVVLKTTAITPANAANANRIVASNPALSAASQEKAKQALLSESAQLASN